MKKTRSVDFGVVGLSRTQMQVSTMILTNKSNTSIIQIPSIATIKLEADDDSVIVLPEYDN